MWTSVMINVSDTHFGWEVEDCGDDGIEIRYWEKEDGVMTTKATVSCQDDSALEIMEALRKVVAHRKEQENKKAS